MQAWLKMLVATMQLPVRLSSCFGAAIVASVPAVVFPPCFFFFI
jgi:hypothetical protein